MHSHGKDKGNKNELKNNINLISSSSSKKKSVEKKGAAKLIVPMEQSTANQPARDEKKIICGTLAALLVSTKKMENIKKEGKGGERKKSKVALSKRCLLSLERRLKVLKQVKIF